MARSNHGRTLRASLCEIERGLFYATYRTLRSAPGIQGLQSYQIGISASDAKQRIEETVKALGYDTIIWKDALVVPQHSPPSLPVSSAPQARV
jgi:hypothetical protein